MIMGGSPHLPLGIINYNRLLTIYLKLERKNHLKKNCPGGWDNLHGRSSYGMKVTKHHHPISYGK
jgi:hypothetical protein